jgi:DNA invertase Pin-like site-specific DNA recombinase
MAAPMDGYVRVSRVAGREGESFISPRVQREKIEAWARLHDVTLREIVEELDVSGARAPEDRRLETLIQRCERGESAGVVTWRVDRFSRSASDTLQAVKRIEQSGARLVGVEDGVDTSEATGKLVLTVLAGLAELEIDRTRGSWRTSRGEYAKRGGYLSGHPPTGFLRAEGGGLVADPEVAPVIREAFRLRADGASTQAVADFLADRGVLPRAGLRKDGKARTRWSREGARNLLRNPVYMGKPNGENKDATIETIVSADEFSAAQLPAGAKYGQRNGRCAGGLLIGLIRCANCGNALHVSGGGPSYTCKGKFATGVCTARPATKAELVDAYVLAEFAAAVSDPEHPAHLVAESAETAHLRAREAVAKAEAELDAWVENVTLRSTLGTARFERGILARQEALDEATRELWDNPDPGIPEDAAVVHVNGQPFVYETWNDLSLGRKRRMLRSRIAEVTLAKADPSRRKHQPISERVKIRWVGAQ